MHSDAGADGADRACLALNLLSHVLFFGMCFQFGKSSCIAGCRVGNRRSLSLLKDVIVNVNQPKMLIVV